MTGDQMKAVAQSWMQALFGGDVGELDRLARADCRFHTRHGDHGLAWVKRMHRYWAQATTELKCNCHDMAVHGTEIAVKWNVTFLHTRPIHCEAPTNKAVRLSGMEILRFSHGRIRECWEISDDLELLARMEVVQSRRLQRET